MKKALTISVLLTAIAALAYFTKPSDDRCVQQAKQSFEEKKLSYTTQTLPSNIDKDLFRVAMEQKFSESIKIEDRFIYKEILEVSGNTKQRIGWGAFGWVNIELK